MELMIVVSLNEPLARGCLSDHRCWCSCSFVTSKISLSWEVVICIGRQVLVRFSWFNLKI